MTSRQDELVTTAEVEDVVAAIEGVNLKAPWNDVAPSLRVALPRRRPLPPGAEDLPELEYAPGIRAALGLDIGPAMLFVSHQQLADWGVAKEHAFERALENVRKRVAARKQFALMHERIAGVPTMAFQSREGWASSLLLLPDELTRVLGRRNGLLLAPMRDLLMLMPLDCDPELPYSLLEHFVESDMNALDLPVLSLIDGRLSVLLPESPEPQGRQPMH